MGAALLDAMTLGPVTNRWAARLNAVTVAAALLLASATFTASARAEEEPYARIVASGTAIRSGPGASHRVISEGQRGDAFLVVGRETNGYWLRVALPDGREGWVLGDTVELLGADENSAEATRRPGLFAPPALAEARGGFTLLGGVLQRGGYVEARPSLFLDPTVALEPFVGLGLEQRGRRLLYGLALALAPFPNSSISPYLQLGFGGSREDPSDEFVRPVQSRYLARAAAGLLVSFRFRVLLRLEGQQVLLFDADRYESTQAFVGGLGTYF